MKIARDAFNLCLSIQEFPGRFLAQVFPSCALQVKMTNFAKMQDFEVMM